MTAELTGKLYVGPVHIFWYYDMIFHRKSCAHITSNILIEMAVFLGHKFITFLWCVHSRITINEQVYYEPTFLI